MDNYCELQVSAVIVGCYPLYAAQSTSRARSERWWRFEPHQLKSGRGEIWGVIGICPSISGGLSACPPKRIQGSPCPVPFQVLAFEDISIKGRSGSSGGDAQIHFRSHCGAGPGA